MKTIKQVSEQYHVTYDTLRYYEKIGLLTNISRDSQGRREYSDEDLDTLSKVVHLRQLGASVAECQRVMGLFESDNTEAAFADGIQLLQRLDHELDERIASINQQKAFLKQKMARFERERARLAQQKTPTNKVSN
jgi:DNA-binding transcriptional MerR regulator